MTGESLIATGDGLGGTAGVIHNVGGVNTWTGTLAISSTINVDASTSLEISGAISGSGGLTKMGTGTLILSGNNSFTGITAVTQGVVNIRHATALGATAGGATDGTTVTGGAALEIQNNIAVGAEALTLNSDGISSAGALRNITVPTLGRARLRSAVRCGSIRTRGR